MIKYYCDKCGKEITENISPTRLFLCDSYSLSSAYLEENLALCKKCKSNFDKLIRRIARKYGAC